MIQTPCAGNLPLPMGAGCCAAGPWLAQQFKACHRACTRLPVNMHVTGRHGHLGSSRCSYMQERTQGKESTNNTAAQLQGRWPTHPVVETQGLCLLEHRLYLGGLAARCHLIVAVLELPQPAAARGWVNAAHIVAPDSEGGFLRVVVTPVTRVPVARVVCVQDGCGAAGERSSRRVSFKQ